MKLSDIELRELGLLLHEPKHGGSDRVCDRARTKLKRLGLIRFDRKAWEWEVMPGGLAALGRKV